ncbi:MAG TPA: radical SAM protein [Spirochaetia bacterium]|nr:radical SAM protein [Spirochaetia bacterium]
MKTVPVKMLGTTLDCRGYWCSNSQDKEGEDLKTPQLMLYVMSTKKCNGACPFCDIQRNFLSTIEAEPDLKKFAKILENLYVRNLISKISITGGEPLLNPTRTSKLLDTIFGVNPEAKVDVTTNGSCLQNLSQLNQADKLATVHVSRHHYDTYRNNRIFGVFAANKAVLEVSAQKYPGKISLNCCLVPGYIDSPEMVEKYLDWAATIKDLKSAGFISLMDKNEFCRTGVVKEKEILDWIDSDPDNFNQDYLYDTNICQCRVWKRVPQNYRPFTAFWWRVDRLNLPYCRQLVFTADSRLMVNFSEIAEISF